METIETMLRNHPHADDQRTEDYADTIEALSICAEVCTTCADACLGQSGGEIEQLRRCIRTNLDCAEVCTLTARLLLRQTETPNLLVQAQLHACVIACQICAEECSIHAQGHHHCHICANACRHCQQRCNFLLGEISSSGIEEDINPLESPGMA